MEGMTLLAALERCVPSAFMPVPLVAVVGGGGKTTAMYSIASDWKARGMRVAATTTTNIWDPRREDGRDVDRVVVDPRLALDDDFGLIMETGGGVTVFGSSVRADDGKMAGVSGFAALSMRGAFDAVVVEADGSRMLPVKAPAGHEPVLPPSVTAVVGVIGLDCLGKLMDSGTVHRPEIFSRIALCGRGEPIGPEHLARLVNSPEGLYKSVPPGAARLLLLNKSDLAPAASVERVYEALAGDPHRPDGVFVRGRGRAGETILEVLK